MSNTVRSAILLSSEPDNSHRTEHDVNRGDLIEELKDEAGKILQKNGFTKIKNMTSGETGWVPTDEIMEFDPGTGTEEIEQVKFALACVLAARDKGVNGASLVAVAWVHRKDNWESNHKGKIKITGDAKTGFGTFNYSQTKWDRLILKHGADEEIRQGEIVHPFRQSIFAAIEAQTAVEIVGEKLNRVPTTLDYCLHHTLGENFHKIESEPKNKKISTFVTENILKEDGTQDKELADAILKGNDHILKDGENFRTIKSFLENLEKNLDDALQQRVVLLFAEIPDLRRPVEIPGGSGDLSLPGKQQIRDLILSSFANAGFGKVQQIAALANAIAESGLDPNARNTRGEDSVGLFQLNRNGGLGTGKPVAFLKVPQNNIDIIIAEAKKFSAFGNATTIEQAVDVFVRKVERPAKPEAAIKKRIAIAKGLLGQGLV